jgi:SAM-dependent methyltransferase
MSASTNRPIEKREQLPQLWHSLNYIKGAEIGVQHGKFSLTICENMPNLQSILLIDPWIPYEANPRGKDLEKNQGYLELARQRLDKFGKCKFIQKYSMDAVLDIPKESLDFVYIDAHHSFDYVMQDIIEWAKRVRKGGMISGHDYFRFLWAGVVEAVNAYTNAHNIIEWWTTREHEPSWFFYKTWDEKEQPRII